MKTYHRYHDTQPHNIVVVIVASKFGTKLETLSLRVSLLFRSVVYVGVNVTELAIVVHSWLLVKAVVAVQPVPYTPQCSHTRDASKWYKSHCTCANSQAHTVKQ